MSILISQVVDQSFDYIIIGGGTAGLVVANRLSSDPTVSVLVIEAGEAHEAGDPNIDIPGQYYIQSGIEQYDWDFKTVPQENVNGREMPWVRGIGLGGTSAINFQCWLVPPCQDIDAIEALGNPGWNWNAFSKYLDRVSEEIPTIMPHRPDTYDDLLIKTLANMGIKENLDPYNGNNVGVFVPKATINPKSYTRAYAANTYYASAKHRSNLTVITHAIVSRVLFEGAQAVLVDLVASGVEFLYDGTAHVARCNREVLVCAGAINSPKILELSGIGRKDVLDKIGVETRITLPGVGENVQEHAVFRLVYETKLDTPSVFDVVKDPVIIERLKFQIKGIAPHGVYAYIPSLIVNPDKMLDMIKKLEDTVEELKKGGKLPTGLSEQYDLQIKRLRDPKTTDMELVVDPKYNIVSSEPGKTYVSIKPIINHPFSRGQIHAKSSDPKEHPEIDPHYFEMDYDMELLVQYVQFVRKMMNQEPFKSVVVREFDPTSDITTNAQIREFIKERVGTIWHTVGSCSMLPREKNGVVSPELVVYGTKNLRVADLSIIPLQIASHTQSIAYVIGEKAADLISGK